MNVVFFNASEILKAKLQIFNFEYSASLNESGCFDVVVYPGQVSVDSKGVMLKTDNGYSGYVTNISFEDFSSMVIQ